MAQKWYQKASVQTALVSGILFLFGVSIPYLFKVPNLENQIRQLQKDNSSKTAEIQRLETQLTPFKTFAIGKYTGSEQERMQKLAERIQELENPLAKKLASATAQVEVTIKSDEQISTRYMQEGGLLAFVKNRKPLLLTAYSESLAVQTGKDEVVYKGEFYLQADQSSALNQPIKILQSADIIQIMFTKIPENSQIVGGKAVVIINSDTRLEFKILPQKMPGQYIVIRDINKAFLPE